MHRGEDICAVPQVDATGKIEYERHRTALAQAVEGDMQLELWHLGRNGDLNLAKQQQLERLWQLQEQRDLGLDDPVTPADLRHCADQVAAGCCWEVTVERGDQLRRAGDRILRE